MGRNPPGRGDEERSLHEVSRPVDSHGADPERILWRQFAEATAQKVCKEIDFFLIFL